jgi:hypothetical protein
MPKRGSYLNWMHDSKLKIPKSTRFNREKLKRFNEELNNSSNKNLINNSETTTFIQPPHPESEYDNSNHDIENCLNNNNNLSFSSDDDEDDIDEQNALDEITNDLNLIDLEQLPIETTCAIILNMFFNARLTQTALAIVVKTFNLFKRSRIPSSFNGLANILFDHLNDNREYDKQWYCNICLKLFQEKLDKSVRRCSTCNSR